MDRDARRTSPALRRFQVWFGGIFLTIGLVALAAASAIWLLLHDDPRTRGTIWAFLGAPLALGTMFTLFGAVFVLRGLRKVRTQERLRQFGTTIEATVVAVEPTSTRVNRQQLWHVRYTYADLSGAPHRGESGYLAPEDARSYQVGGQALIRYDPEHPSTSVWLGRDDLLE